MAKCEVVHHIRGRVRLRVPSLGNEDCLEQLSHLLSNDKRISSASFNKACCSLTLTYKPVDISVKEIIDIIASGCEKAPGQTPVVTDTNTRTTEKPAGKAKAGISRGKAPAKKRSKV
ncbi:MAG: hypothetical protein HQL09_02515 [Nitrospirae bacterium]|nr:hypothetical protein [Nitrospirota bacterium]